ncbi:hypothetical protein ATJ88_3237 [Isoptericola jiangsuensis]|uniref:Uncharacterized protein n=1 Tax=Isoptericola jiangsuensis TaxID=548579 RepID=A0A2A9F1U2_9MICO|nr:hypothetical protein [Isoptericola jiangsuensis]PFG44512.1 hypothetical protein ATJ88_3237 [Isoptericola jiangsuensis]
MADDRPGAHGVRTLLKVLGGLALVMLLALAAVVVWAAAAVTGRSGGGLADELAERVAIGIADDVEGSYAEPLDAERLVQMAVADPRRPPDPAVDYDVVALAWEGDSGEGGATVDVAIHVEVASWSDGAMFGERREASSTTQCWRFVVRAHEHDDVADHERFDCPQDVVRAGPSPTDRPSPSPTPLPSLGPDAEAVVLTTLDGLPTGATAAAAESALAAAFDGFVDVRVERKGSELVAAVGVLRARDCVVGVRPDGEAAWRFSDFDRVLLEPGELGCVPWLYLSPVTTH